MTGPLPHACIPTARHDQLQRIEATALALITHMFEVHGLNRWRRIPAEEFDGFTLPAHWSPSGILLSAEKLMNLAIALGVIASPDERESGE